MPFSTLGLNEPILSVIEAEGYIQPTAIQTQAIPQILKGRDIIGCSQTGTGKTAAFSLPMLQKLAEHVLPQKNQSSDRARPVRALILSPTRELAAQIGECLTIYSRGLGLKHVVIFGGVRQSGQTKKLRSGVDIIVATPGRLMDLLIQGHVKLNDIEMFVLDEADRMLDMGFIDDIWEILSYLPEHRQSLMFSATMPPKISMLAKSLLHDPVEIHIAPEMPAADTIEQRLYFVEWAYKSKLLVHLLASEKITRVLIFTQTKRRADVLLQVLLNEGLRADVIHSDRLQRERKQVMDEFRSGKTPILVASDIAARGIDVDDISHVINYELPRDPEVYIHRIGRTGRAGETGVAISFCDIEERLMLDEIQKLIGHNIPVIENHPYPSHVPLKREEEPKPLATGIHSNRRPGRRRRF